MINALFSQNLSSEFSHFQALSVAVKVITSCFAQPPILMEFRFRDRDDLSSRYDLELQRFVRNENLRRLCSIFSETFYQAWLSVASRKLTFGSQSGVSRLVGGKNLANYDKYISKNTVNISIRLG